MSEDLERGVRAMLAARLAVDPALPITTAEVVSILVDGVDQVERLAVATEDLVRVVVLMREDHEKAAGLLADLSRTLACIYERGIGR